MTSAALKRIFEDGLSTAIPRGELTVSSWASQYRFVSPQRSARPGRWDNRVFPFLTGVMDAVTEPDVKEVVLMKSSQVGGTECLINILGYYIHQDPSLMMYIGEQEDKAKAWKQEAFDPTIAESPELRRCMIDVASGSSDNNQSVMRFRGGQLTIGWASSPAMLSSRPVRIVALDEVDAFKVTKEGSAIKLAEARTKTFNESRKLIYVSSPRDTETSIIEPKYLASDQREFYVPCPHCRRYQTLRWENVRWDDEPEVAYYCCENGCVIEHEYKYDMLTAGIWRAGAAFRGMAGFRINEIYSPMTTWGDMAVDFLEAKKHRDTLRVFINTRLGATFADEGERIDYGDLKLNREDYETAVPHGVTFLTAGVDVQGDRLEVEVVGWGRDLESWSIDYRVIEGSPSIPEVWDDLTEYLLTEWPGIDREYRIKAACVDSGGHHTAEVYDFCKRNKGRRWFAIKGANVAGKPLVSKPSIVGRQKIKLFTIGTDTAKDEIFAFLRVADAGPGFCHFPATDNYGDAYLKQLCSERKMPRYRMGRQYFVYEKVSPSARNEALDVRVYATAAREIIFPRAQQPVRRHKQVEPQRPAPSPDEIAPMPEVDEPTNVVPIRRRRRLKVRNPLSGFKL